jgi:hypothetical protein
VVIAAIIEVAAHILKMSGRCPFRRSRSRNRSTKAALHQAVSRVETPSIAHVHDAK